MSTSKFELPSALSLVIACALLAGPAAAGESPWYLAGKLGQASVERDFGPRINGWRVDNEESAASVEVGYSVHRNLDLQAGYHDLGTHPGVPQPCPPNALCVDPPLIPVFPVEAEFTGFSFSAVPRLPVSERVSLFGRLGVLDWEGDTFNALNREAVPFGPSDRELLAGVGGQYAFPSGLGVLVEYQRSDILNSVSVGASWRF